MQPSRWKTKEFYFYYVCFALAYPYMFYVTYGLSQDKHHNYHQYSHLLTKGWLFGRKVDNSDMQYRQFRNNLPLLSLLACIYLLASHFYRSITTSKSKKNNNLAQIRFYLVASVLFVIGLHGTSFIKMMVILTINYWIGKLGGSFNPVLTWVFNLIVLFMNEHYEGYKFASIGLGQLDLYRGILPRWNIFFNFCMLRLISFNMDYYWNLKKPRHDDDIKEPTDKERITTPCPHSDYNYFNYLAFVLYTPLYICGPIITFNDFISQIRQPSSKLHRNYILKYALRLVLVLLTMEVFLHFFYVVAISKAQAWQQDTPMELCMIGYINLNIIWLKLLIPWRFFRLWALADGIHPEENMVRCMSNNFSAQRFWKSWHRSFNRWTIRYIYIPLGGSNYLGFSMWVVFTFVALWHDIELRLLAWGWLICLFLLPEIIGSRLFTFKKFGHTSYYRMVCGIGAVCNILMMMIANLVGFCLGLDGMKQMVHQIFSSTDGLLFLGCVILCLYVGAQVMFEIRETERRRGDPKWIM
ncbi:putative GUP1-Multimembrane-spanning protein essential for proton symport of glycerol [Backusella circina FSU 941]|nr:putative GUP1-Multimembrane-spanning protein essential for proton symport of glycerol [Backusella circina FSU 941]